MEGAICSVPAVSLEAPVKIRGGHGKLAWLPVTSLAIDVRYQRLWRAENTRRVREIAEAFDWSLFSPIVVASSGGQYCVIDGQHRAAAAKAVGAREVPAWVVDADSVQQARMFIALNATTTKVPSMQLWHSRLAARDHDAMATFEVCRKAGVQIMRYPVASIQRRPHQTMCPDVINSLRQLHGDRPITDALTLLRMVGEAQDESLIVRRYIRPMHTLCKGQPVRKDTLDRVVAALARLNFDELYESSRLEAKARGEQMAAVMVVNLSNPIARFRAAA